MWCHRIPERSFFYRGIQLPVCARCTGILLGQITIPLFFFAPRYADPWIGCLLCLPALMDGLSQYFELRESWNGLRFLTGILAGVGSIMIATTLGRWVPVFIRSL